MPDEAQKQTRRGPLAVLLLFVGIVLGSAGGAGLSFETDGSSSQLRHTRAAKGSLAIRAASQAAAEEDDAGDPLALAASARIVSDTAVVHPSAPAAASGAALPERPVLLGYRARAPPAA